MYKNLTEGQLRYILGLIKDLKPKEASKIIELHKDSHPMLIKLYEIYTKAEGSIAKRRNKASKEVEVSWGGEG
jgi:hypothetical protein